MSCDDEQAFAVALSVVRSWPNYRELTADDVHRKIVPYAFCNSNNWGAVFRAAKAEGLIVATGKAHTSVLPSRRGSIQRVWKRVPVELKLR